MRKKMTNRDDPFNNENERIITKYEREIDAAEKEIVYLINRENELTKEYNQANERAFKHLTLMEWVIDKVALQDEQFLQMIRQAKVDATIDNESLADKIEKIMRTDITDVPT